MSHAQGDIDIWLILEDHIVLNKSDVNFDIVRLTGLLGFLNFLFCNEHLWYVGLKKCSEFR
jgi:hypothetical protein